MYGYVYYLLHLSKLRLKKKILMKSNVCIGTDDVKYIWYLWYEIDKMLM